MTRFRNYFLYIYKISVYYLTTLKDILYFGKLTRTSFVLVCIIACNIASKVYIEFYITSIKIKQIISA